MLLQGDEHLLSAPHHAEHSLSPVLRGPDKLAPESGVPWGGAGLRGSQSKVIPIFHSAGIILFTVYSIKTWKGAELRKDEKTCRPVKALGRKERSQMPLQAA